MSSDQEKAYYPSSCPPWENIYTIQVPGVAPFNALCDSTLAGDGWLVVARRFDGSENFYRNWTMYKQGFGDLSREFFIGLDNLHAITASQAHELYIYIEDFEGQHRYALYSDFAISNENKLYEMQILGKYSGDAGDALRRHANQKFSTFDKRSNNCPIDRRGAWWYKDCADCNLFAMYMSGKFGTEFSFIGMSWDTWRDARYSLKVMQMMVRPKSNRVEKKL
ncbi:maker465 [Drosophila busckii]|uniref:Maker465 n=1 Tax=Drosophila busckii TaxID=30019 RepID=A0A0M4EQ98_DROBS|nr:maker465 [Drosophila busckii]